MKLETIKNIASDLNCLDVSDLLSKRLSYLQNRTTTVTITGGDNVGKTTLINSLLETNFETSALPTKSSFKIVSESSSSELYPETVVKSEWMTNNKISLLELTEFGMSSRSSLIDFGLHFVNTDICLYLISVNAPLSATELRTLETLNELCIETIVCLSKADQITAEELLEVNNYLSSKLSHLSYVRVLKIEDPLRINDSSCFIKKELEIILSKENVSVNPRQALENLFVIDAISTLFEKCNNSIEKLKSYKNEIDEGFAAKTNNLSEKSTVWIEIRTELARRKQVVLDAMRSAIEKREQDTVRQLKHIVDLCQDVKLCWEKELPYRLEDSIRVNSQIAAQTVNSEIIKIVNWLNFEIKQKFNQNLNQIPAISCSFEYSDKGGSINPEISDSKKIRIVARVGTAATVIAAGTLFATMGIGGIVMATSMLAGVGAEFFMSHKQSESKKKVLELIPNYVSNAHQEFVISASEDVEKTFSEILDSLKKYQTDWYDNSKKQLDKERRIALFNCDADISRNVELIEKLNQISSLYIK